MNCGCRIRLEPLAGHVKLSRIDYCPKHASVDRLIEALETAVMLMEQATHPQIGLVESAVYIGQYLPAARALLDELKEAK